MSTPRYPKLIEIAHALEGVEYGSKKWRKLMVQLDIITGRDDFVHPGKDADLEKDWEEANHGDPHED
jgi:hypothetical protein